MTWLKIGVDLHGVIDRNVEIFKVLSVAVRLCGIKIYVISGPPKEDVEKELRSMWISKGIHYDDSCTIVDYLQSQPNINMWKDDRGTWWTSEENWWSAKAAICKKLDITMMIDNTDKYKPYFKGTGIKFILYDDMV